MDAVIEELARLRELLVIPETNSELTSSYGMGPAASKVYGVRQGVSLGGYGEFYFAAPIEDTESTGAVNRADFYRFITYFGYKFSDKIIMNTEIEFEHATTSSNHAGKSGSVSVEFSYLDFLLHDKFNIRTGNLLLPVGLVNQMHEPAFYRGNFRPELERRIIPTTWREMGAGVHGRLGNRLRYTAYVVNGLNAAKFDGKGVRGGRQKGNQVLFEDAAIVAALGYDHDGKASLGSSFFAGGADHNMLKNDSGDAIDVSNWIWEGHGEFRHGGFEARAMVALSHINGADKLSAITYPDMDKLIPEDQSGWYAEASFDVAPYVLGSETTARIAPWIRFEDMNLQSTVPEVAGLSADPTLAIQLLTIGVDVKPHPSVVLKFDYVHSSNDADSATSDELRVGAGFVY
jgi:hypothetical protein